MKIESAEGADLGTGVAVDGLSDGAILQGKVAGEDVILVRRGSNFFAVGASCTHYGGPLAKGLVDGDNALPVHHGASVCAPEKSCALPHSLRSVLAHRARR